MVKLQFVSTDKDFGLSVKVFIETSFAGIGLNFSQVLRNCSFNAEWLNLLLIVQHSKIRHIFSLCMILHQGILG